jgi:peroxiredoxin
LVGPDGRVASHIAVGDESIRKLIDEFRRINLEDRFAHIALKNGSSPPRKIGQTIPDFEVNDLAGRPISNRSVSGRPTLITFWSPTCPHCVTFIDEVRAIDKTSLPRDLELVILSSGDPKAHEDLNIDYPVVIDDGSKIASTLGAFGTPSAVLIDEQGKFASETAVGAKNIWSLVRRPSL